MRKKYLVAMTDTEFYWYIRRAQELGVAINSSALTKKRAKALKKRGQK